MEYRILGRTGVKVSCLCLGTDNGNFPFQAGQWKAHRGIRTRGLRALGTRRAGHLWAALSQTRLRHGFRPTEHTVRQWCRRQCATL